MMTHFQVTELENQERIDEDTKAEITAEIWVSFTDLYKEVVTHDEQQLKRKGGRKKDNKV